MNSLKHSRHGNPFEKCFATDPNRSHGHTVLLGGEEDLDISGDGLLHLPGLTGDLGTEAGENLGRCRLKLHRPMRESQIQVHGPQS